jgi:hypothetical protein
MILNDFVMLGRTVPEQSKKHGLTVCSAGYSKEMRSLLRVYPLPRHNKITKWALCRVPLKRPKDDHRQESWRIDSKDDDVNSALRAVNLLGKANKDIDYDFLEKMTINSIKELNAKKKSLAIIAPKNISGYFEQVKNVTPYYQETLFERIGDGKTDINPRVKFTLGDGFHDLQLREWGCHEYLRKNREKAFDLWDALRLNDSDYEHLFFIGNTNNHRNVWLIISTIFRKKRIQFDLFE